MPCHTGELATEDAIKCHSSYFFPVFTVHNGEYGPMINIFKFAF